MKERILSFLMKKRRDNNKVKVYKDDIFIVSYPKSGNTWVRFLIANYLNTSDSIDFKNLADFCPEYESYSSKRDSKQSVIFKSHSPLNPKFKKVIYIIRDGRDVAVSYYFYYLKFIYKNKKKTFNEFLESFNNGSVDYGKWSNHVNNWLANKPENFLLLKYENLLLQTEVELMRILDFINIPFSRDRVFNAVKSSKFETMAKIEKRQIREITKLSNSNTEISFMRKGKMGDYINFFNNESEEAFLRIHGEVMRKMKYINN